jgi:hypothetical protein
VSRTTCDDSANALLPWLINGTLEPEEEARVRGHLEQCSFCREELNHLGDFANALAAAPMSPPAREAETRSRLPLVVAAALLLPALLGIYWATLGFPMERRSLAARGGASVEPVASLDLGAGPLRGDGQRPSVIVGSGVGRVSASFLIPAVAGSGLSLELRDSEGRVLGRDERFRCSGEERCTYALSASAFAASGEYAIVLIEREPGKPERSYTFPFLVTISSPPKDL